jgi:hypothetical protein
MEVQTDEHMWIYEYNAGNDSKAKELYMMQQE